MQTMIKRMSKLDAQRDELMEMAMGRYCQRRVAAGVGG